MPNHASSEAGVSEGEIRARLGRLIRSKQEAGVPLYYVSQIGSDLGIDTQTVEKVTGRRLAEYIREELSFSVGRHGSTGNALFVYFSDEPPAPTKRPRYKKSFWDAFASPSEKARFLDLSTLQFGTAEDLIRARDEFVEIKAEFLPGLEEGDDAAGLTSQRIADWLGSTGLRGEEFADERGHSRHERNVPRQNRESETLLERLVAALTPEERGSLVLPIEVTSALAAVALQGRSDRR